MPFPQQKGNPFTRDSVEKLSPNQTGVYGLYSDEKWIYIGSGNIRERLLAHLEGNNLCIAANGPTHWVAEITPDTVNREKQLIMEHRPICNQRAS